MFILHINSYIKSTPFKYLIQILSTSNHSKSQVLFISKTFSHCKPLFHFWEEFVLVGEFEFFVDLFGLLIFLAFLQAYIITMKINKFSIIVTKFLGDTPEAFLFRCIIYFRS